MSANWSLYEKRLKIDGINIRESQINLIKEAIVDNFEDSLSYRSAYVNNSDNPIEIQVINNKNSYIKTILMYPEYSINVGDILEFDNLKWICVEVDKTNPVQEIGIVNQAKHILNLNQSHISYNIPCIVEEAYQLGDTDNKYLTEPSTNIIVRIPNNEITQKIKRADIYKIGKQNYRVVDINDIVQDGILVLKMEFALEEQVNNKITTVTILNGTEINLNVGQTLQLNVEVKENNSPLPYPTIIYSSSNDEIATVDENGLVTIISEGSCEIATTYNGISDTIIINSVAIASDIYEIILTPTNINTIKLGTSLSFEAHAMKNGIEDLSAQFNWYLINVDGSFNAYATISHDGKTCVITASSNYQYINKNIKIKVELVSNVTKFEERQIKLISLI